jgi:phage gp46-like protein
MADIQTIWQDDFDLGPRGDWAIVPPGLAADLDLETAVLISLFTDATAQADDELPDFSGDRRGWWGDDDADVVVPKGPLGSRLWLLVRAKATEETRQRAEAYAVEALQWLLDDGVAARVDVAAGWLAFQQLGLRVRVVRDDGTVYDHQFTWAWQQLAPDASYETLVA